MAAEYDLLPQPPAYAKNGKQMLYPRIVSKGTISVNDVIDDIVVGTSFTRADIIGVLAAMEEKMIDSIIDGYHFELGNIGYFWAKLKAQPVENKKDIHSQSISIANINFRASAHLKKSCNGKFEKAKDGFRNSSDVTMDDCKQKVMEYFKSNFAMTITDFCSITGLLRGKARVMIQRLVDDGVLTYSHGGTHRVYHIV